MTTDWRPYLPRSGGNYTIELRSDAGAELAIYDFGRASGHARRRRLLVLKLDHLGDFLIGLPALEKLRQLFPTDHITLVCGSWNYRMAREIGLADEIVAYDFFPENSALWNGEPRESMERFRTICRGRFDIAIDLRVDEDTRPLLGHVDAAMRCGIGSRARYPFLDVVLPDQFERRANDNEIIVLDPDRFESRMPIRKPFFHETDFSGAKGHLIYGPYIDLPSGRFRVSYGLRLFTPIRSFPRVTITIDVTRGKRIEPVAARRVDWRRTALETPAALEFTAAEPGSLYEFRVHARGRPILTRMQFFGVRIEPLDGPLSPRFKRAELHVGEQLSLLVQLIGERTRPLYSNCSFADRSAPGPSDFAQLTSLPDGSKHIVIAPLSNREVRDWSLRNYGRLVQLLLEKIACGVTLLGSQRQREQLAQIVEANGGDRRIANLAGQTDWLATAEIVRAADLVISNNSGVAHLAAACGAPTLAIYSGSHQPQEWGPRGEHVRAVTAVVPCSPCGHERLEQCAYDHRCMRLIRPEIVAEQALMILAQARPGVR
ncbi:MAG TPA: glycosyltransferase family 9 protein [Stellaceae bacterium]|nr:glycosyltransferase family 9 protein [Stellaceae bacterium]